VFYIQTHAAKSVSSGAHREGVEIDLIKEKSSKKLREVFDLRNQIVELEIKGFLHKGQHVKGLEGGRL
jgi:hypothetical protein